MKINKRIWIEENIFICIHYLLFPGWHLYKEKKEKKKKIA